MLVSSDSRIQCSCYTAGRFARAEVNVTHNLHHPPHTHTHLVAEMPTRRDFVSSLVSTVILLPWALAQTERQSPSDAGVVSLERA